MPAESERKARSGGDAVTDFMVMNFQVLFSGLALGAIYALVALGFVLIIRATNVVNFAQGDFAMLGAFAMVVYLFRISDQVIDQL